MVQLLFIQLPSFNEDEYTVDDTASIIDQVGDLLRGYSYNVKNENEMKYNCMRHGTIIKPKHVEWWNSG